MRNILKWNKSTYTILSCFLIILVFGSFIELAMGGNGKSTIVQNLLISSAILSWLGMRFVAGASWILTISAAICSVVTNNLIMEFYGYLYITFGFIGLLLHSGLNPGEFIKELVALSIGDLKKLYIKLF